MQRRLLYRDRCRDCHVHSAPPLFLSYASEDASSAQRICAALRAGTEVWFDQSELRLRTLVSDPECKRFYEQTGLSGNAVYRDSQRAVLLSYASEDAYTAHRICAALRSDTSGVAPTICTSLTESAGN
jgi:hypothetical protein